MNITKTLSCTWVICCLLGSFLQAQIATISEEMDLRVDDSYEIIGEIEEQLYVIKDIADGAKLYCFDPYLKISWENDIRCERKHFRVLGSIIQPDYIGIAIQYKKKGEHIVQFQKLDMNGVLVDTIIMKNYGRRAFTPNSYFVSSHDQQMVAIFNDKTDHTLEATAIDTKTMQPLWSEEVTTDLSYQNDLFEVSLSNRGDMYAVFYEDYSRSKRELNSLYVVRLNKNNRKLQQIQFGPNLFFDGRFYYDNINEQLVGAGLYDEKKMQRTNGYFFLQVPNSNMENYELSFHHFRKDIITTIRGKESEPDDRFGDAYVNDLILKSDGGVVLVVERYKMVSQMHHGFSNPRMAAGIAQAEYHYDDIIVLNIQPDGELGWGEVLYKRQFSRNDEGYMSSFFIMKTPTTVRFIYNDEVKTKNNKVGQYVMNRKGAAKRRTILDTYGYSVNLMFSEGVQFKKNEVIVPSLRNRDFKLVRIRYN